jgi:transposase, IS30 family
MQDKRKFKQLTDKNRWTLHELRSNGCSMRACARVLGVHVSTVSRELTRNAADVAGGSVYLPDHAILCATGRRQKCHPHIKMDNPVFRRLIIIEIQRGRPPEIIAGRLRREMGRTVISHETQYDLIYDSDIGKHDNLYEYLPRGKNRCAKRKGRKVQRSGLEGRVFIEARSKATNERCETGH